MPKKIQRYNNSDWYTGLLEDIGALITETRFVVEENIIKAKHEVGKLIVENEDKAPAPELILNISRELKVSTRTIEQAVQFYRYDPELKTLEEGKNISWRKCLARMQTPLLKEPCTHAETMTLIVCADCGDKVEHID